MQEKEKVSHDTQGLCSEWKLVLCHSLFSALKGLQQPGGSVRVLIVLAEKMGDAELRLSQKSNNFECKKHTFSPCIPCGIYKFSG